MTKPKKEKCANCLVEHKKELPDVCLPAALLGVSVYSRESLDLASAKAILQKLNVDQLWDDLGPIIDQIEEGYYDIEDDDDGCPLSDPDCMGRNEDRHDECETHNTDA